MTAAEAASWGLEGAVGFDEANVVSLRLNIPREFGMTEDVLDKIL